jgi:RHS repeat-associated protein
MLRKLLLYVALVALSQNAESMVYTKGSASVDLGSSRYSVPIAVPLGTGNLAPALSLEYSSAAGNGAFGMGWTLAGLSEITRCPLTIATEGTPGGVTLTMNDRFCLDGMKLVVQGTGAYGVDSTEYRTETETWTKVVSYGSAGNGPMWFRVWTHDGLIKEYGNSTDSRAVAPGTSTAYRWAVNRVADRQANFMTYSYSQNASSGEFIPMRIDYTGNTTAGTGTHSYVLLWYETRPDVISAYVSSSRVDLTQRAVRVQTYTASNGATFLAKDYRLAYDNGPSSGMSRLASLTECGGDGSCFAPTTFAWGSGGGGLASTAASAQSIGLSDTTWASAKVTSGDFNGDGIEDVFIFSPGGSKICYGPSFTPSQCRAMFLTSNTPFDVGDFNGDGIADIGMVAYDGSLRVCFGPNLGPNEDGASCFVYAAPGTFDFSSFKALAASFRGDGRSQLFLWSENTNLYYNSFTCDIAELAAGGSCHSSANPGSGAKVVKGDFDGDGRQDVLIFLHNQFWQQIFCPGPALTSTSTPCQYSRNLPNDWTNATQILAGDYNGDGKTDLMIATNTDLRFCPGPGVTTSSNCTVVGGTSGIDQNGVNQFVAGDFNGDGRSDLAVATAGGIYYCTGPGITNSTGSCLYATSLSWVGAKMRAGDFNGDATSDIFAFYNGNAYVVAGGNGAPDLMASVTNGVGAVASFLYQPLTNTSVYTKGTSGAYPEIDTQAPAYSVSQACTSDAVGGLACTSYKYAGARVNVQGRGFMGFATITVTDQTRGRVTTQAFRQDYPYYGLLATETTSVGTQVARTLSRTYSLGQSFRGVNYPSPYESTEIVQGLDGVWKNERISTGIDPYGNSGGGITYFGDGTTNTASYAGQLQEYRNFYYTNDTANWLFGQVYKKEVWRAFATTGTLEKRTTNYSYKPGTLLLTQEDVEPSQPQYAKTTAFGRDAFGNVTSMVEMASGLPNRTTTWTYDSAGRFKASETNALNQTTAFTFDARFGVKASETDANGLTTSWTYNSLGQQTATVNPDSSRIDYVYGNFAGCGAGCNLPGTSIPMAWWIGATKSGQYVQYDHFDLFDRSIRKSYRNFADTNWVDKTFLEYGPTGQVIKRYAPHERGAAIRPYTAYSYDSLGRVGTEATLDGATKTYGYAAIGTAAPWRSANSSLGSETTSFNFRMEPLSITDAAGGVLSMTYNLWGKVATQTTAANAVVSHGYDLYGNETTLSDPDLGTWTYTYNGFGERTSQTDAKSQTTTTSYDALGRKTAETMPGYSRGWTYDAGTKAIGRLSSNTSSDGVTKAFTYDAYGRLATTAVTSGGITLATTQDYDGSGRVSAVHYPSGFTVSRIYSTTGALSELRSQADNSLIWKAVSQSPLGITDEDFGNGTGNTRVYDSVTGRLRQIASVRESDGALLQNLTYGYDAFGRMTSRAETTQSLSETFAYDGINRLITVTGPAARSFTYDALGNMASQTGVGTYSYPSTGKVHAVSSAGGFPYSYDSNGSVIAAGGTTFSWTPFNLPSSVTQPGLTSSWLYDADGTRTQFSAGGQITRYVITENRPILEQIDQGGTSLTRAYIYAGQRLIAIRTVNGGAAAMRYVTVDHLGSLTLFTDGGAQVAERLSYEASGKRRQSNGAPGGVAAAATTARGFTGHEHLDSLSLIHMNGRLYDPVLGRMLGADPRLADPLLRQNFDRYSYVYANPLNSVDPDGYETFECQSSQVNCVQVDAQRPPRDARGNFVDGNTGSGSGRGLDGWVDRRRDSADPCTPRETQTTIGLSATGGFGVPPLFVFPAGFLTGGVAFGWTSNGLIFLQPSGSLSFGLGLFFGGGLTGSRTNGAERIHPGAISSDWFGTADLNLGIPGIIALGLGIQGSFSGTPGSPTWQLPMPPMRINPAAREGGGLQASVGIGRQANIPIVQLPPGFGGCREVP